MNIGRSRYLNGQFRGNSMVYGGHGFGIAAGAVNAYGERHLNVLQSEHSSIRGIT